MSLRYLSALTALAMAFMLWTNTDDASVEISSSRMQGLRGGDYPYCTTPFPSSSCAACANLNKTQYIQCTSTGYGWSCGPNNGTNYCTQCIISAATQCGGTYSVYSDNVCSVLIQATKQNCTKFYNPSAGTTVIQYGSCPNNCPPIIATNP